MYSETVVRYLIDNGITISFMESCTAGLLASMLTDTPGASNIFQGSLVTYSNECKIQAGVDKEIIEKYGVYSPECAISMAEAIKDRFNSRISIGITGTTGNVDIHNSSCSTLGEAYYCIIADGVRYEYNIEIDVAGMTRKEIKQYYANQVYGSLAEIIRLK